MNVIRSAVTAAVAVGVLCSSGWASERSVTVVGEGEVTARPDVAEIMAGVVTLAPTVQAAMEGNRVAMTAVLAALEEAGVAAGDIATSNYSVQVERPSRSAEFSGSSEERQYRVYNMVRVRVRALDRLDHVLGAVAAAGANEIHGLRLVVDDEEGLAVAAQELAVADARQRAARLARLHGAELGQVLRVEEASYGGPVARAAMEASMAGPIRPGEMAVSARVHVTYELK